MQHEDDPPLIEGERNKPFEVRWADEDGRPVMSTWDNQPVPAVGRYDTIEEARAARDAEQRQRLDRRYRIYRHRRLFE